VVGPEPLKLLTLVRIKQGHPDFYENFSEDFGSSFRKAKVRGLTPKKTSSI